MKITPATFSQVFMTASGSKFRGLLQHADKESFREALPARRFLLCAPNVAVHAGERVYTYIGQRFVLASHAHYDQAVVFKAFEVEQELSWYRRVKEIDPVTGLERDYGHQDMGMIWVSFEPISRYTNMSVSQPGYEFVTGQAVESGDLVDGRKVRIVENRLGIRICTCE